MFKKDDIVRFKADLRNDIQIKKFGVDAQFIVDRDQTPENQTVRVFRFGTQETFRFYPWRLELAAPGFAPGVIVKPSIVCPYASVVAGREYEIQAIDGDRLKLKGVSNKLKAEYFIFLRRPDVAPVKPVEKKEAEHEKRFNELTKQINGNAGTCSFYMVAVGGKEPFFKVRGPCHAALSYEHGGKYDEIGLNFNGHIKPNHNGIGGEANLPGYKRFLQYILNDSPFSQCFIDKDVDYTLKYGARMDVDKNRAWVYTSAIATRHYTEFDKKREMFDKVMDLGFDGNTAFLVSTFIEERPEGIAFNNFGGGHHVLQNQHKAEDLFRTFANGFIFNKQEKTMRTGGGNRDVFRSMGNEGDKPISSFFNDLFKKAETVKAGWVEMKVLKDKNALNFICIQVMKKILENRE